MEITKPLGYLLSRSMKVFKNQMSAEFRNQNIEVSFEQYVILHMIDSKCDLIQQDLANYLQKDKSLIVRQIDCLIEKQYLVRQVNKEDKRKKKPHTHFKRVGNDESNDRISAGCFQQTSFRHFGQRLFHFQKCIE